MPGPLFVSLLRRSNFYVADSLPQPPGQSFKEPQQVTTVVFETSSPKPIRIVAVNITQLVSSGVSNLVAGIESAAKMRKSSPFLKQGAFFRNFGKEEAWKS
jgi:hypothetical protein